jgi:hypothetical protein
MIRSFYIIAVLLVISAMLQIVGIVMRENERSSCVMMTDGTSQVCAKEI